MGKVIAASVGWHESDLTLGVIGVMRQAGKVILRTSRCGAAHWLSREGIPFTTLDALFDQASDYDDLIDATVDTILSEAAQGDVLYCVNDPCDASLQALVIRAADRVNCMGGAMAGTALMGHGSGGVMVLSAIDCARAHIDPACGCLIRELDDRFLASDVKLHLMERYPDEWPVYASLPGGGEITLPLCELDRLDSYDHRLCVMVPPISGESARQRPTAYDLLDAAHTAAMMADAPQGCSDPAAQTERDGASLADIALRATQAANMGDYDMTDVIAAALRKLSQMSQF